MDQADSGLTAPNYWGFFLFHLGRQNTIRVTSSGLLKKFAGTGPKFSSIGIGTGPQQWRVGGWKRGVEADALLPDLEDRVPAHYSKWSKIFSLKLKCRLKDHLKTLQTNGDGSRAGSAAERVPCLLQNTACPGQTIAERLLPLPVCHLVTFRS